MGGGFDMGSRVLRGRSRMCGALVGGLSGLLVVLCGLVLCGQAGAAVGRPFVGAWREVPAGRLLGEPNAVAVDRETGDVFVADAGTGVVDVFSASGGFVTQFGSGTLEARGLAVDEASGDVYVPNRLRMRCWCSGPTGRAGTPSLGSGAGRARPRAGSVK